VLSVAIRSIAFKPWHQGNTNKETQMRSAIVVLAVALSGCATQMNLQQQAVQVAGRQFTYVMAEGKDPSGVNFVIMDRYDERGALMSRDAASGEGILLKVIPAAISGAALAGGMIGAASLLEPDTTNVSQTNDTGSSSGAANGSASTTPAVTNNVTVSPTTTSASAATSASNSASTASSVSKSVSTANQSQGQAQVQSQKQTQSQNQSATSSSKGKIWKHFDNGNHYGHHKDKDK